LAFKKPGTAVVDPKIEQKYRPHPKRRFPMAKSDLLAVAFTDVNGNDKYNPGKDTLIASLVDTSNDGTVSVGDTIHFGTYPAIADGSNSGTGGNFTILESTVTDVLDANSTRVVVDTALGTVIWNADPAVEFFETTDLSHAIESVVRDSIDIPGILDLIQTVAVEGPGEPNTSVDYSTLQPGDQAFLDVLIFL
jgi:hypothetical protein